MKQKYPKHFYDPIRIEVAVNQIQHDCRKLFSSVEQKDWKKIDRDINEWFLGDKFELEPVHDFWNFFGCFARSLKLKSLLSWATAENIIWSKEDVTLKKIIYTWDFPGLEFMGRAPFRASKLIDKLKAPEMREERKKLIDDSIERSKKYLPRDRFRIVLLHDPKGGVISEMPGYYILEGNRRTTSAILKNKEYIPAFVARFKDLNSEAWPENYWVKTGLLRDLIFLSIGYNKKNEKESFDIVRKFYQLLYRDFDIVRIATFDKSFKNYEKDEKLLLELFLEDLK